MISDVFDPCLFQRLVVDIKAKCPTITNTLEQLVLSPNISRNVIRTENLKMKAAIHLLASLLDIRDQHAKNDIHCYLVYYVFAMVLGHQLSGSSNVLV